MSEPKDPPVDYPVEEKKPWPPGATTGEILDLQADRELVQKARECGQEAPMEDAALSDNWATFKPSLELPRMAEESLKAFINDYLEGRIYTSADCPPDNVGEVFVPLLMGDSASTTRSHSGSSGFSGSISERRCRGGSTAARCFQASGSCTSRIGRRPRR